MEYERAEMTIIEFDEMEILTDDDGTEPGMDSLGSQSYAPQGMMERI